MSITDWPEAERPREKLLAHGPRALSDAELLAIFLRSGTRGLSAVDLARNLILHFGGLRALLQADCDQLCAAKGLGPAKYAQLQAVLELARRHLGETLRRDDVLKAPQDTRQYLIARLCDHLHEVFSCLFLDSRNRVISCEDLFRGSIDSATCCARGTGR